MKKAIETIKEQAGLTGATATDEAASNKEKIAARNATVAMMEAADRLREIGHRLTAEGQPEAADDKYRMVGVYMLRSEPDYVILDVDLGQPGKIGSQEEYDCLGSLPLGTARGRRVHQCARRGGRLDNDPADQDRGTARLRRRAGAPERPRAAGLAGATPAQWCWA